MVEFLTGKEIIAIALLLIIGATIYAYIEHKNSYVTATIGQRLPNKFGSLQ